MLDEETFNVFYETMSPLIRGLIVRVCGLENLDDTTQEVFLKCWKAKSHFLGRSAERTWVYRIALHTCFDELRKRKSLPSFVHDKLDGLANSSEQETNEPVDHREAVRRAVLELEESLRVVTVLHYFEDLSLKEIAQILEIPQGTAKSRLFSARSQLEKVLRKILDSPADLTLKEQAL